MGRQIIKKTEGKEDRQRGRRQKVKKTEREDRRRIKLKAKIESEEDKERMTKGDEERNEG